MSDKPTGGTCGFCGKKVEGDCYCHGCGIYVCEDCTGYDEPWGNHKPEDHPGPDDIEKEHDGD